MAELTSRRLEDIPPECVVPFNFDGHVATVASAPEAAGTIEIGHAIRDPKGFRGPTQVHDLVNFGRAMAGLIGRYQDPDGLFKNTDSLPDQGIVILSHHFDEAKQLVGEVDALAQRPSLYDDPGLCLEYLGRAREGYALLDEKLSEFSNGDLRPNNSVTLLRAGWVTTRLARGLPLDAEVDDEVLVDTKRTHPIEGEPEDLMVSVRWVDRNQIPILDGARVELADFVNPASWSSTAAFLLSAIKRGAKPELLTHRSFMATAQGIDFANRVLRNSLGIEPRFYAVGISHNLTNSYYLKDPAVGDAGDVLTNFIPDSVKERAGL